MSTFGELPEETTASIFAFLNPLDVWKCRRVSKSWRQRLVGCAAITWSIPSTITANSSTIIEGVLLKVHRSYADRQMDDNGDNVDDDAGNDHHDDGPLPASSSSPRRRTASLLQVPARTKGQLAEPRVCSSTNRNLNEERVLFCARGRTLAFRVGPPQPETLPMVAWDTLDLAISSCLMTRLITIQPLPSVAVVPCRKRTRPLFKRILLMADLSGIEHLRWLSLRGCSHLQELYVPPNLEGLDVSGCCSLQKLVFPLGPKRKLKALNVRGCRSLEPQGGTRLFASATPDVMRHIKELDMSSTKRLDTTVIADAIRMTTALESLSLRYVATNTIILALAESEASKTTLRYLDVSFSEDLGDEACETLVNSAIHLERLNLRACRNVSTALYNSIPVWLQNRHNDCSSTPFTCNPSIAIASSQLTRRKGDVMFQFSDENMKRSGT